MLSYELHFNNNVNPDIALLKATIEQNLNSEVDISDNSNNKGVYIIFHKKSVVKYSDASIPAQTVIFLKNDSFVQDLYQKEIEQSWQFRTAGDVLKYSKCALLITEMMAQALDPNIRAEIFHGVLAAVIKNTKPIAIVCKSSQQVIDPQKYLESTKKPPIERPGSINVLFYNIQDSKGDILMITSGLGAFGHSEIQCHFRKMDPGKVAAVLYNTAIYIFDNGDVIKSGQTVEGCFPGSKWKCQYENSLLEKNTVVLDLNPGLEYSAGNRI